MSDKVTCPVCGEDFKKQGFPSHFAKKHPDKDREEYMKKNESEETQKEVKNKWKKKTPQQKAKEKLQKIKEKAKK